MAAILPDFREDLADGDLIVMNDPYAGGMHLPDIFVIKPIFVGASLSASPPQWRHMMDVGGRVPGGNAADSTEIFQEGLRIPPVKLSANGKLDEGVMRLLRANVRHPDIVLGDLFAEVAACNTAEAEFRRSRGASESIRYVAIWTR